MITYKKGKEFTSEDLINLYIQCGLRRPIKTPERIKSMIDCANVFYTAWDKDKMIGVVRCMTDYSFCCYIADLGIDRAYKKQGIGRELIRLVREELGEGVAYILLSSDEGVNFYKKIGFEPNEKGFWIARKF